MPSKNIRKSQRLIALFVLFLILFNYPVISIINQPVLVMGVPLLYLYLFITWLLMIILLAWIISKHSNQHNQHD